MSGKFHRQVHVHVNVGLQNLNKQNQNFKRCNILHNNIKIYKIKQCKYPKFLKCRKNS